MGTYNRRIKNLTRRHQHRKAAFALLGNVCSKCGSRKNLKIRPMVGGGVWRWWASAWEYIEQKLKDWHLVCSVCRGVEPRQCTLKPVIAARRRNIRKIIENEPGIYQASDRVIAYELNISLPQVVYCRELEQIPSVIKRAKLRLMDSASASESEKLASGRASEKLASATQSAARSAKSAGAA